MHYIFSLQTPIDIESEEPSEEIRREVQRVNGVFRETRLALHAEREREMSVFIMDTHIHTHTYIEDRQTERERGGEKVCFLSETNW